LAIKLLPFRHRVDISAPVPPKFSSPSGNYILIRLAFGGSRPHSFGEKFWRYRSLPMTQTSNRFFDEVARLMNDAAGVAQGIKREVDTMFKTQAEKWLRDLDLVKREEFEAVKDMARLAREENEVLRTRIAALEAKLGAGPSASPPSPPPPPSDPFPPVA
jgi:BMFP domain-containing protein YqiC